jgi:hypothetical protein
MVATDDRSRHSAGYDETVSLTIDGSDVSVPEGTAIWPRRARRGSSSPALRHAERYDLPAALELLALAARRLEQAANGPR